MSSDSLNAIQQLPKPVPADGLFTVLNNIADTSFNDPLDLNSTYAKYVLDPANLIGTDNAPYVPVALPAYVTTLYQNVYNLNNNLQNNIQSASIDNRLYPTSYAVQKYVQSQISGVQIISSSSGADNTVLTTLNNTIVTGVSTDVANNFEYSPTGSGLIYSIAVYYMDTTANSTRNGSSKVVVFGASGFLTEAANSDIQTGNQAFLYAGEGSYFLIAGKKEKYYQFTYTGDTLTFTQLYQSAIGSTPGYWLWLVQTYNSRFSATIQIPNVTPTPPV
jgi:hypothetical protein